MMRLISFDTETGTETEGRSAYGEISLPPEEQRLGAAPEAIAFAVFGLEEPTEGNFAREWTCWSRPLTRRSSPSPRRGVLDDSVEWMRY